MEHSAPAGNAGPMRNSLLEAFLGNERFLAWVTDVNGRFIFMNASLRALHGLSEADVSGLRYADLFPRREAEWGERVRHIVGLRSAQQFLDPVTDEHGGVHWWMKVKFPIAVSSTETWIGCMAMDVTDQVVAGDTGSEMRAVLERMHVDHEEERKHLARELHDAFGGTLAVIKSQIALLGNLALRVDPDAFGPYIANIRTLIDELLSDSDRLIAWLRPPALADHDFAAALLQLGREFEERHGIPCDVTIAGRLPVLDDHQSLALYRIVQESLTNVSRHARATRAAITARVDDGRLEIAVEDDGRGVAEPVHAPGRFGIIGMRERASMLGGTVVHERGERGGTRVRVSVPLEGRD